MRSAIPSSPGAWRMAQDTEFYCHLLGIVAPWAVDCVGLDPKERPVAVCAGHPSAERWLSPDCSLSLSLFDTAEERVWWHPQQLRLPGLPPRPSTSRGVPSTREVPGSGLVGQIEFPVFTSLFERWSVQVMWQPDTAATAEFPRVRWDAAGVSKSGRSSGA